MGKAPLLPEVSLGKWQGGPSPRRIGSRVYSCDLMKQSRAGVEWDALAPRSLVLRYRPFNLHCG
jgi:hypothetical protein